MEKSDEIVIHKFIEPVTKLYNDKDKFVGYIHNSFELNDVKIQIQKKQLEGYYIMFKNQKIRINKWGGIMDYIEGFYDLFDNQIDELLFNYKENFMKKI